MVFEMDFNYNMYIDDLTGLPNLKGLYREYQNQDLTGMHFIYVDIDDFNRMNIIFGIDTVEDMLVSLAGVLQDYCGKSSVYRVGNDQFMLVTTSQYICEPSELQRILKTPFKHHHIQYVINASVCVIDYDEFKGDSLYDILKLAHITIDLTKSMGRNTLIYATKEHKERYRRIKEIEHHIYEAHDSGDFFAKYRPFVDTFNGEVIGFEAVSRWILNGELLKPHDYLEIAEWTGIIYDLEMKIFDDAIRFYRSLQDRKDIKLSKRFKAGVNLSLHTLLRIEIKDIMNILTTYEVSARDVIIEIRENYITDHNAYKKVQNLYELGFVMVLDHYSNTTSSLSYLADLKVDVLKLSETLLEEVNKSEEYIHMMAVYKFFVDISKKFDLSVVSTGVENKKDLDLIRELGVNIATGNYFCRAVVEDEFVDYLKTAKKRKWR
ncbi:EAL domain-containing protein [Candidatus Xianfuyuplasma coldseepsis]|uniref:EAL domain-containing protein n=1 Tax=Candidatus Xianfuyuplasma coldseepsis TaxID=2782163 RepID=A0A7L7KPQ6_9MOLU|nr:EAL domain-containing protein [Xianfuyuplasma coldseepsis]QMS84770.1 EAL domain-containing protein [Xianfuyuplasma coldseepsis]